MGKGIYSDVASEIMKNDPPGTKIYISENRNDGRAAGFEATKRSDGSVKLKKHHID